MTQKQFKDALLRGQGRCLKAVQSEPEKYASVVLWACSHTVAFDPQCEGTRAWFVYRLIDCYQDKSPFLEAAITSMNKTKSDRGWKMLYLAELLSHFADDGEKSAEQALWRKYEDLYSALIRRKRSPSGVFSERDVFAMLCQVLADNESAMIKIAEDIGNLYLTKSFFSKWDFAWLFDTKAKRYMASLKKKALTSDNIAAFLRIGQECKEELAHKPQDAKEFRSARMLSIWLKKKADQETVQEYANAYLSQSDPEARAKALEAFWICPFPGNPLPLIEDAKSDFLPLKKMAWHVLENIRHPSVRAFAIAQLPVDPENALPVFIANYQPEDEAKLIELVKSIPVDFDCTTSWHSIHLDILGMTDRGLKAPASLLPHIFETTYCSCCRHHALRQMGKRRLLSKKILEECLEDSYEDIRTYAQRCIKRRARNNN